MTGRGSTTIRSGCGGTRSPTRADWRGWQADTIELLTKTLRDAKVRNVAALVGKPVEVTLDGNALASWRILKEVL